MSAMVNRSKPVKLGLIGYGQITETRHLPTLWYLPDAKVMAVADIDPDCPGPFYGSLTNGA